MQLRHGHHRERFHALKMKLILGLLLALSLVSGAPDSKSRRVYWQNDLEVPMENDEAVDILPSSISSSPKKKTIAIKGFIKIRTPTAGELKVKLPHYVRIIQDKFGDRSVIKAINWSNKLRSKVIDFPRHKNFELVEKLELVEDHNRGRYRRDISGVKKEDEKKKKKLREEESTILEPTRVAEVRKVLNSETRPTADREQQMIKIELPTGVHYQNKMKLFHTNDTGFVNILDEDFPLNKLNGDAKNCTNSIRISQEARGGNNSSPFIRRRRSNVKQSFIEERIELDKITQQYNRLSKYKKKKFCEYLKKELIKEPLEMLMALLGRVYLKSDGDDEEFRETHWDRIRGMRLNRILDKKARQKLILKWACKDQALPDLDENFGKAFRMRKPPFYPPGKFHSWRKTEFPFSKEPSRPSLSQELILPPKMSKIDQNPDVSMQCSLKKLNEDNNAIKGMLRLIIDRDKNSERY